MLLLVVSPTIVGESRNADALDGSDCGRLEIIVVDGGQHLVNQAQDDGVVGSVACDGVYEDARLGKVVIRAEGEDDLQRLESRASIVSPRAQSRELQPSSDDASSQLHTGAFNKAIGNK